MRVAPGMVCRRRTAKLAWPVLLFALGGVGCFTPRFARHEDVRPLTLRVVDAGSRAPLAGVPVAYTVDVFVERGRFVGIWPQPEPGEGIRTAFKARGRTDARGEVVFHVRGLRLAGNEDVYQERVFVNLEAAPGHPLVRGRLESLQARCRESPRWCSGTVDELDVLQETYVQRYPDRVDALRNPLATHRGLVIFTDAWTGPRAPREEWTEPDDRFRVVWCGGLEKPADTLELALERLAPQATARR